MFFFSKISNSSQSINSCGERGSALGHKNSCNLHAAEVLGRTKALSMSTRLAVEKLASPQQALGRLREETWAGLLQKQGLRISQEEAIVPGCAVGVTRPSCPDHSLEPPWPGRGTCWVGHSWRKQQVWGMVVPWCPPRGVIVSSLDAVGDWVMKGSYRTAWSVPCDSSCTCSYAYGRGPAIGPHTGKRCWPMLAGVWRAIAPLMKPTAANQNLYRGWKSCVSWHCDDEPLFGKCGDAKLIVSVSLGS